MRQAARPLTCVTFALFAALAPLQSYAQTAAPAGQMKHVAWSRNANIYEVNIRQ